MRKVTELVYKETTVKRIHLLEILGLQSSSDGSQLQTFLKRQKKNPNYSEDYFAGQHQVKKIWWSLFAFFFFFTTKGCNVPFSSTHEYLDWSSLSAEITYNPEKYSQAKLNSLSFNPEQKWMRFKTSKQTTTENNICLSLLTETYVSKKVSEDLKYSKQSCSVGINHLDKFLMFSN